MGKKDAHKLDLDDLLDGFAAAGDAGDLTGYLLSNSNLPGRRANLELAQAFGDMAGERAGQREEKDALWVLCEGMTEVPAVDVPANDPREFISFCGTVGVGAIGAACAEYFEPVLGILRWLSSDSRWRMREAVCFGLQRLMAVRGRQTLEALETWVAGGDPLEMRAVAAGVAEPPLLQDAAMAMMALQLHRDIVARLLEMDNRKSGAFRVLRRGLGYTLSVVVCAVPQEGFAFLAELAESNDRDVRWIVRENLKKSRLIRPFPREVESLKTLVT